MNGWGLIALFGFAVSACPARLALGAEDATLATPGTPTFWFLTLTPPDQQQSRPMELRFEIVDGKLAGAAMRRSAKDLPLQNLVFDGNNLSFAPTTPFGPGPATYVLKALSSDRFEGYAKNSENQRTPGKVTLVRAR